MNPECKHLSNPQSVTKSLQGHKIYKDQCARCFQEPKDKGGIYICMSCFNSFCHEHLQEHSFTFPQHCVYTNFIMRLKETEMKEQEITKLAIGKEGGALLGDEFDSQYKVYCHQCKSFNLENEKIVEGQVKSLINMDSPFKKQALVAWEVECLQCQHTLTLQQELKNSDLSKCSQCELSTNLWLCLTCGNTGCGRKNWDGSGGNNHGIGHYNSTKHPVVVKLGTITTEGQASLYCYQCNNQVRDDQLHQHLGVLGINVKGMKKTQKTIAQLQLELNLNFTLSRLVEDRDGKDKVLYGGDWTGMNNIGNSCYLNSVLQGLNAIDEFRYLYHKDGQQHVKTCKRIPSECFYCQMAKVAIGLNNGKYSQRLEKTKVINGKEQKWECQKGVSPYDYKLLMAEGNNQFLSARQQDALEYLQIVFDRLNKEEPNYHKEGQPISTLFDFDMVNKLVCTNCQGYKLVTTRTNQWKFPVPPPNQKDIQQYYAAVEQQIDPQIKKSRLAEDPQYNVQFKKCLENLLLGDSVSINCPQCKSQQIFTTKNYFKTTPRYILSVANRFILDNWVPKKLNPIILMDEKLSIEEFLLENSKEGTILMEEGKKEVKKKYSEDNVKSIEEFGYSRNAAIRALIAEKDNLDLALGWIMDHMDRPDLNDPVQGEGKKEAGGMEVDQVALSQIMQMGFEEFQAQIALIKHKSNIPAALQWLFNIGGDVTPFMDLLNPQSQPQDTLKKEQPSKLQKYKDYELFGVIVHLGKSVHHGHYVIYLKKNESWVLYNDEKVSIPVKAMLGKGYLYLWKAIK